MWTELGLIMFRLANQEKFRVDKNESI